MDEGTEPHRADEERADVDRAVGSPGRSDEEQKESRAKSLEHGGEGQEGIEGEPEAAERAADAILDDSEERTHENAPRDPEDDSVTRRSSEETA